MFKSGLRNWKKSIQIVKYSKNKGGLIKNQTGTIIHVNSEKLQTLFNPAETQFNSYWAKHSNL